MPDEVLISQIHTCTRLLDLYGRSAQVLSSFIPLLPKDAIQDLVRYDAQVAVEIGAYSSEEEYLELMYGDFEPRSLDADETVNLLDKLLVCNLWDGGHSEGVQKILEGLDPALSRPETCAQLLAHRSHIQVAFPSVVQDSREILAECRRLGWTAGRPPDEFARENWNIIQEFVDVLEPSKLSMSEIHQKAYELLFTLAKIEKRHPLYATEYALYLSPRKRIQVADPIDQIVLESKNKPALIRRLSPRDFERFIAKVFEGFGFDVEITARSRDGGVDVICMSDKHDIPYKVAVEAKRYHPSKPVTVELVRSFVGANALIKANKLVYVTTSRYTRDAIRYASDPVLTHLIELKAFEDVVKWAGDLRNRY